MFPHNPDTSPETDLAAPSAGPGGASVTQQALEAQTALLPYALGAFGVSLPIYVWVGSHAPNLLAMAGSFVSFATAWAMFYAVVNWLKTPAAENLALRGRVHIMSGLCWSVATAQIALFADQAGPAREPLLLISLAAAVICIFFTAPWLPSLLIVGPAVAAGPLVVLYARPETRTLADEGWGGIALTLALALILNRILRRQFAMAAEREVLIAERAGNVEAARRLAQSKSDLVSTLSHEIRNGLTGVVHVLAAAAGRAGRAPTREQLAAALNAANDLISVLNTTLDSETAEAGRLAIDAGPIEPVALVRDLVLLARPNATAKGLELTLHVDPELAEASRGAMLADAMRVRQILSNLIGNAVKFTASRSDARIEVGREGEALFVRDNGIGFDPEFAQKLFAPFQRLHGNEFEGTGIGLAIVQRLIHRHDGRVWAESAPGRGATFRFTLGDAEQESP